MTSCPACNASLPDAEHVQEPGMIACPRIVGDNWQVHTGQQGDTVIVPVHMADRARYLFCANDS